MEIQSDVHDSIEDARTVQYFFVFKDPFFFQLKLLFLLGIISLL